MAISSLGPNARFDSGSLIPDYAEMDADFFEVA